jgi:hypothetical protein
LTRLKAYWDMGYKTIRVRNVVPHVTVRTQVLEYRVLRRIFVQSKEEVPGRCRKLHNEELRNLYSLNIWMKKSRKIKQNGHRTHKGETENTYKILVRKPEGRGALGRNGCRCEDSFTINHRKGGCGLD